MKEAIEELIERYEKRVKTLNDLINLAVTDVSQRRHEIQRSVYRTVIQELKELLEDEQDET